MSVPNTIQTENLTRLFGDTRALDALSLEVPSGIIFGFLGPNGAGKTTTINLLLGLLEPTGGGASVLGFDIRTHGNEIRANTGALLEHPGVYERMSAAENLDFYGRVWRLPAGDRRARIRELLQQMDLWERRGERAGTWSRGMRQRLALARTLLHRPRLVFLDEPTAGLDVVAADAVRDDLANLVAHEGTTVFLTTHNMAEAERLCDLVAVIRDGRLVAIGCPDDLKARTSGHTVEVVGRGFHEPVLTDLRSRPDVTETTLLEDRLIIHLRDEADVAPLVRALVLADVDVEEVHRKQATMEEVFLSLMEATP